jgi:hypothetical protein
MRAAQTTSDTRFPSRSNRRIARLILVGLGCMSVALLGLYATTFYYYASGCGSGPSCLVVQTPLLSSGDLFALVVLTCLPLASILDFRWDRRLLGGVGLIGAVVLTWAIGFGFTLAHAAPTPSPATWYARPPLAFFGFASLEIVGALLAALGLRGPSPPALPRSSPRVPDS